MDHHMREEKRERCKKLYPNVFSCRERARGCEKDSASRSSLVFLLHITIQCREEYIIYRSIYVYIYIYVKCRNHLRRTPLLLARSVASSLNGEGGDHDIKPLTTHYRPVPQTCLDEPIASFVGASDDLPPNVC